jgi:hypothetical protein
VRRCNRGLYMLDRGGGPAAAYGGLRILDGLSRQEWGGHGIRGCRALAASVAATIHLMATIISAFAVSKHLEDVVNRSIGASVAYADANDPIEPVVFFGAGLKHRAHTEIIRVWVGSLALIQRFHDV